MRSFKYEASALTVGTYYTPVLDLPEDDQIVEQTLSIEAGGVTGTTTTVDVTPQYSYEKDDWFSKPSSFVFTQITTSTSLPHSETLDLKTNAFFVRWKIVVGGDGDFTGKIRAASKKAGR